MPDIVYRKARPEDAAQISALAIAVWVETYADQGIEADFGRYIADHLSESHYQKTLADEGQSALLAFSPKGLVGFALVDHRRDVEELNIKASELEKLYIHRNFKGCGIGRALFDLAYEEALSAGSEALWLLVYHGNHDAIAFYRKLGLHHIGDSYFNLNGQMHLNHRFIRAKEKAQNGS